MIYIIKTNINHKISLEDFNNVISSVKGIPNIKLQSSGETLDIFLPENKGSALMSGNSFLVSKPKFISSLERLNIFVAAVWNAVPSFINFLSSSTLSFSWDIIW